MKTEAEIRERTIALEKEFADKEQAGSHYAILIGLEMSINELRWVLVE